MAWIVLAVGGLYLVMPWWFDRIVQRAYGATVLSLDQLGRSSPESTRLLRRLCTPKRLRLPKLMVLPTAAPVSFTYGNGFKQLESPSAKGC
ncbi:MAG: hypothetical protein HC881_21505 [Leptolyngbyaceae cyanobacterium SL_7_1]|nr:hypothetical protein [Leptolyngbyaceae cyanobacterium SL_7_1]